MADVQTGQLAILGDDSEELSPLDRRQLWPAEVKLFEIPGLPEEADDFVERALRLVCIHKSKLTQLRIGF